MKYIDTHGHLNSEEYSHNFSKYVKEANEAGVEKIIIPGTCKEDSLLAIKLSKKFDNVFAMVAYHPADAHKISDANFLDEIDGSQLVGVGECGIDLYRDTNPPLEIQQEVFRKHIRFAQKWDLPVIVHTRNAEQETYDILNENEFKGIRFIIHCSTINKEWAKKFINMGGYISFSGIVTFKNAKEVFETMMSVPLNRLLSETDAPLLSPEPVRGKINLPENVKYIAEFIANNRPEDREEVLMAIYNNAHKIFSI